MTPTIQFTRNASKTLRQAFDLPTNADVARHLCIDPGHYSRLHRQLGEVSSQLLGRLIAALALAGHDTTGVIEVIVSKGNVVPLDMSWQRVEATLCGTERLAS